MLNEDMKTALNLDKYLLLTIGDVNIVIDKNTSLSTVLFEYGDEIDMSDLMTATYKVIGG